MISTIRRTVSRVGAPGHVQPHVQARTLAGGSLLGNTVGLRRGVHPLPTGLISSPMSPSQAQTLASLAPAPGPTFPGREKPRRVLRSVAAVLQPPAHLSYLSFLGPNEHHPALLEPHLAGAPEGVYVGVGTERTLMAAALMPHVTAVLQTDCDPDVVLYNQINAALLAVAEDRQDYLQLRLHPIQPDGSWLWDQRVAPQTGMAQDAQDARETLSDIENRVFWKSRVVNDALRQFRRFHRAPPESESACTTPGNPFVRFVHYLYDDRHFATLQRLARANKIRPTHLDFCNAPAVQSLFDGLHATRQPVSVLDLSNAWWERYIPRPQFFPILRHFREIASPTSLLILTHLNTIAKAPPHAAEAISRTTLGWHRLLGTYSDEFCYKIFSAGALRGIAPEQFSECLAKLETEGTHRVFASMDEMTEVDPYMDGSEVIRNVRDYFQAA